ncbi:hypothetical protein ETB97_012803 [Aspergillus alliaceus]|uniref:Uncharacterized protein n=1 Tax=Petromyces alliaceus TaxID=209559 RepID=A0A8H6E6S0_PETAA|nr:hypothetical protein ETB97_012803 [Aspergillus burnettii]
MKILESIQHGALYRISGAFKTTSRAALDVYLHVPPPQVVIKRATEDACLRILASPFYQTLQDTRKAQLSRQRISDKAPTLSQSNGSNTGWPRTLEKTRTNHCRSKLLNRW